MKKILTYKGAVMTWECDSNNHMNVMYYVNKFENGGRNFSVNLGIHHLLNEEVGSVVVEQNIKYLKEVFADDVLYIESSLLGISNKAVHILHEMYNGHSEEKVAEMKVVFLMFDKINRKALPFPEDKKRELLKLIE